MSDPLSRWRWSVPPKADVPGRRLGSTWRRRLLSADPGLVRLHAATGTVVAVSTTLLVERGLASTLGRDSTVPMLVGAIVAMLGSRLVTDATRGGRLCTIAGMPIAFVVGVPAALVASSSRHLEMVLFIPLVFLAGYLRRFGPRFSGYGFLGWMGYFLAVLLGVRGSEFGVLVAAAVVASGWLAVLFSTVLREHPERAVERLLQAFWWRGTRVAMAALAVLDADLQEGPAAGQRARRRLHERTLGLNELALLIEGQLGALQSARHPVDAAAIRTDVLRAELAFDAIAGAARTGFLDCDLQVRGRARAALAAVAIGDLDLARHLSSSIERPARAAGGHHHAPGRLARAVRELDRARRGAPPDTAERAAFSPAVTLTARALPGTGAIGKSVVAVPVLVRGPLARLRPTTRQAVQMAVAAALAILVGAAIDPVRYYWALIAAFVCFSGTSTVAETARKGAARSAGTLTGLVFSVLLAELTAGHTVTTFAVIIAAIFLGFYLQPVSYAAMIFFITIMIGQLYTLLHRFSEELLVLRLKETAAGAAVGIAVSMLVFPTRTRTLARVARQELFAGLRDVLDLAAADAAGERDVAGLVSAARVVDLRLRQYVLVTEPLLSSHEIGSGAPMRRRGASFAMLATRSRALVQSLVGVAPQPGLAAPLRRLAEVCGELATRPSLRPDPVLAATCRQVVDELAGALPTSLAARVAAVLADDLAALVPGSAEAGAGGAIVAGLART